MWTGYQRSGDIVKILPGYIEYEFTAEDEVRDTPVPKSIRGRIEQFSRKSQTRFRKAINSVEQPISAFVTLTFHDEWLAREYGPYLYRSLRKIIKQWHSRVQKRTGIKINGHWRKEFERRKMGRLAGEYMPHYHLLVYGMDYEDYQQYRNIIMSEWVACQDLSPEAEDQALEVAYRDQSFIWMDGKEGLIKHYISKYMTKDNRPDTEHRTGAFWGKIGEVKIDPGSRHWLDERQSVELRKLLRRMIMRRYKANIGKTKKEGNNEAIQKAKLKKKIMENSIKKGAGFHLFIKRETLMRMLSSIGIGKNRLIAQSMMKWCPA
jgi:hypothetical protein